MTSYPFVWGLSPAPPWVDLPDDRRPADCGIISLATMLGVPYTAAIPPAIMYGWTEAGMPFEGLAQAIRSRRPVSRGWLPGRGNQTGLVRFLASRPQWSGVVSIVIPDGYHFVNVTAGWVWNVPEGPDPDVVAVLPVRWTAWALPDIRQIPR